MVVPDETAADATHPQVGVIVVAAGESRRMLGVDKVFVPLMGRPLIFYSLRALHDSHQVQTIVLVISSHNLERGRRLVDANNWHKSETYASVVSDGRTRCVAELKV